MSALTDDELIVGYTSGAFTLELIVDGKDLTGYTVRSQIRHEAADRKLLAEFTCTVDPDQTANEGLVRLALTSTQTAVLAGDHVMDVLFKSGTVGADWDPWIKERPIRFKQGVTRD